MSAAPNTLDELRRTYQKSLGENTPENSIVSKPSSIHTHSEKSLKTKGAPNPIPPSIIDEYKKRHEQLKDCRPQDIKRAWFTMAHMILEPGSSVVDVGCSQGVLTYIMAVLNPDLHFIGVDYQKKKVTAAEKRYVLPNLEYKHGDILDGSLFKKNTLDAIINSYMLHDIYSEAQFHDGPVIKFLEDQFEYLKPGGLLYIHDFSTPPPGEYVFLEMPDLPSTGDNIKSLSEPDLLLKYASDANPNAQDGCDGFFMEERPARFPKTRLFRLPYKWAYEFIMRKDRRDLWTENLTKQFTFFTPREYRKTLRNIGARVLYTAPQWDERIIRERFEKSFLLYDENMTPLGNPPTSFIAVAQKVKDGNSLRVHERRPAGIEGKTLRVNVMKNEKTGKVYDVVGRNSEITDIIPYRINEDGRLNVFIHESLPRGIVNAVPRTGKEIDGKRWSGHMTEAISLPTHIVKPLDGANYKETVKFARDYLGLKPALQAGLEKGPSGFPAPDFIDEAIHTRYLRVTDRKAILESKSIDEDVLGFSDIGHIREVSAQSILDAVSVGFIPNGRLETQVETLFEQLEIPYESWSDSPIHLEKYTPEDNLDGKKILDELPRKKTEFKKLKGSAGQVRTANSVFVDEGRVKGGIKGLKSKNIEFAFSETDTLNKAVVIPLTKHASTDEILAGIVTEYLPVPERYNGNGTIVSAPSFTLPKEVRTMDQAKLFVAKQLKLKPEQVSRFGESYFCHIGVTPMRIFPFVAGATKKLQTPQGGPVEFAPLRYIGELYGLTDKDDFCQSFYTINIFKKMYRRMCSPDGAHHRENALVHKQNYETGYGATVLQGSYTAPISTVTPNLDKKLGENAKPLTGGADNATQNKTNDSETFRKYDL